MTTTNSDPVPVPRHLSEEERALTVPTSGPRFDFLELIRDYASALLNHPGTKRHEAMLQRVLDAHGALLTTLATERGSCGAVSVDVRCDRPRNHLGECCGVRVTPYTVIDGVTVSAVDTVTWSNPAALAASSTETPHA